MKIVFLFFVVGGVGRLRFIGDRNAVGNIWVHSILRILAHLNIVFISN